MEFSEIFDRFKVLQGTIGVIVRTPESEDLVNHQARELFPLASTAKVALGAVIASIVMSGDLSWDLPIVGLVLDSKEDSHILYPHLRYLSELKLRHVVEIMIACHDHHCAEAVSEVLGGWKAAENRASELFRGIKMSPNPRDETNNVGRLDALANVIEYLVNGYHSDHMVFEPVIAGLVRMADKTPGIPSHHQWNMTGGLPHALLNVGVLGDPMTGSYLVYGVAGRDLVARDLTQEADDLTADFLQALYATWRKR